MKAVFSLSRYLVLVAVLALLLAAVAVPLPPVSDRFMWKTQSPPHEMYDPDEIWVRQLRSRGWLTDEERTLGHLYQRAAPA